MIDFARVDPGSAEWWLVRLERRLIARQNDMKLYNDYYVGQHRMTFHTLRMLEAFGKDFKDLRINYCGVVVDALNERLSVDGLLFGEDDAASEAAWNIWQRNNLDAAFARGTRMALAKGECSLLVWPDDRGEPRIYVEDGSEMIVAVDPADPARRRAAMKRWYDEDDRRLYATVYLADGIYKYQSPRRAEQSQQVGDLPANFYSGGGAGPTTTLADLSGIRWERREVENEPWPLPNPLNEVPVVALPNKPDLAAVGESELVRVVPIQDAINANVVNVMLAGQFSAFRQKWATNVRLELDPKTKKPKTPWTVAVDSLMTAPPPKPGEQPVQFGEFGQTDLDGYIKLHEAYVQSMATITRVPPHYFLGASGVIPSGESLRAAETGLSHKARERSKDFSDPVEEAARLAFRWKAMQSTLPASRRRLFLRWAAMPDAEVSWRDPETRAESAHVDALQKLSTLGIPLEAIWSMLPASPQTVRRWKRLIAQNPPGPVEPTEEEAA